ncbi:MAG: hypothetical protein GX881_00865 [Firmicutes bacterium]|nr:hypothetical protein [Bacillota bacterium]
MIIPLFLAAVVETAYFGWKAINVEGPPTAALSLDLSGAGSVSPKAGTHALEKDKLVIVEARPKKGWVFSHWEGPVADGRVPRTTVTLDRDVAVKAVFVEEEPGFYTYKIKTWGAGKVYPGAGLQEFLPEDAGSVVPVKAVPGPGHIFDRWTLNGMEVGREALYRFALADGAELIAHFKPFYTVSVDAGKGGRAGGPAGRLEKGEQVKVEALSEPGYIFSEWIEDGKAISNSPTYVFKVEEDRHLTARFLPVYELSVSSTKGGRASASRAWAAAGTGVRVTARPDPGYAFLRWTEGGKKAASGIDLGFLFIPLSYVNTSDYRFTLEKDRHLVAEFAPVYPIKVSVAGNRGGRVATTARNAVKGQRVTVTAVPDKGYLFDRWTEGSREYSGEVRTIKVDRKHRLTAHFVRACQVDTAVEPAGSAGQVWGGGAYKKGENVILRALAVKAAEGEKEHYFAGWYENGKKIDTGEEEAVLRFAANKDRRITARFEPYIAVSAAASPEGSGRVYGAGLYKKGETAGLKAVAGPGYEFEHWLDRGGAVAGEKVRLGITAEEDSHYEAVFKKVEQYTVELSSSRPGAGHVSGGGTFNEGTLVTVFAIPKVGYNFFDWTEDGSPVSEKMNYSFYLDRDYRLTANFFGAYFLEAIRAEPEIGGKVEGKTGLRSGEVNIKAFPSYGYRFDEWTLNEEYLSNEADHNFVIEQDCIVVGHFVKAHPVNISFGEFEGGTFTGDRIHDVGASVTVAAEPDEDHVFDKWLADVVPDSDEPEYTFTMPDEPVNLVALFLPLYDIKVNASPAEGGTASVEDRRFVRGEQVTVEAEASEGYDFYRWEENGEPVHASAIYTFTAEKDRTLTAVFRPLRTITLGVQPAGWGQVTAEWKYPDTKQHPEGAELKITATPGQGYTFKEWTSGGVLFSGERVHTFTVGGSDLHLVAHFDEWPSHEISVESANPGWGTVSGGEIYDEGSPATVVATPNYGYYFVRWLEGGTQVSTSAVYPFTVTGPRHLVAEFREPVVTASSNNTSYGNVSIVHPGGTTAQGSPVSVSVAPGSNITLQAHKSSNGKFDEWREGGTRVSTAENYPVNNIVSDRTFEARFSRSSGCPYIYTHDGSDYHYEHAAISGSWNKVLEETGYYQLDHLAETDGEYRIKLLEEVPQKSFVNAFSLWAVDYPADAGVIDVLPDRYGNIYTITERIAPMAFYNDEGHDLLEEITADGVRVKSDYMRRYDEDKYLDLYVAEFPVKADAAEAKFMVTVKNDLLREASALKFLQEIDAKNNQWWIEHLFDSIPSLKEDIIGFLYAGDLMIEVWDGAKWVEQDLIRQMWDPPDHADFLYEAMIPIDLSTVDKSSGVLKVRLKSPTGFFVFGSVAVDYSENQITDVHKIEAREATLNGSLDVLPVILDPSNEQWVRLPLGDEIDTVFPAPKMKNGLERDFIFELKGYYHYNVDSLEGSPQFQMEKNFLGDTWKLIKTIGKTIPKALKILPDIFKMLDQGDPSDLEELSRITNKEELLPWMEENREYLKHAIEFFKD